MDVWFQIKIQVHGKGLDSTTNLPPLELQPSLQFKFMLQLTQQLQQQLQLIPNCNDYCTQWQHNCNVTAFATVQLQRTGSHNYNMTTPELQHIPIATHQLQHTGHTITTSPHLNCNTQHIPIATHTNCNTRVTQLQHTNCNTHATQLQLHHNWIATHMSPPNFGDEVTECDIPDLIHGHGVICMTLLSKQIHLHDHQISGWLMYMVISPSPRRLRLACWCPLDECRWTLSTLRQMALHDSEPLASSCMWYSDK